ncbi:1473_t:CDS:2, partial [Scutellospora calospora]
YSSSRNSEFLQVKDEPSNKIKKRFSDSSFLSNSIRWFTKPRRTSILKDKSISEVNENSTKYFSYSDTLPISTSHRSMPIIQLSSENSQIINNLNALESMKYHDAINLFSDILLKYPNSYSIRCDRAYASYQVEEWDRAIGDLNFAILKKPKNPRAYTLRGEIYRLLNSYKESLMDFNKSLKLQPKNVFALRARAEVYYSIKHFDDSINDLNLALDLDPNNVYTLSRRAKVYCALGFYGASLLDLNKALEID